MPTLLTPTLTRCVDLALLYAEVDVRERFLAAIAVASEIIDASSDTVSAEVRPVKLTWWDDELRRLAAGAPRHPLTKALSTTRLEASALPLIRQWLVAARTTRDESDVSRTTFRVDAFRRYGAAWHLALDSALSDQHGQDVNAIASAMYAVYVIETEGPADDPVASAQVIAEELGPTINEAQDPCLAAMAELLRTSLHALSQNRAVPAWRLMIRSWRAARKTNRRNG